MIASTEIIDKLVVNLGFFFFYKPSSLPVRFKDFEKKKKD